MRDLDNIFIEKRVHDLEKNVVTKDYVDHNVKDLEDRIDIEKELFLIPTIEKLNNLISTLTIKKLWENNNTGNDFLPQGVTLSSDDYDMLLFNYRRHKEQDKYLNLLAFKNQNTFLSFSLCGGGGTSIGYRNVTILRSSITFDNNNLSSGSTASVVNNSLNIPAAIYGIKFVGGN